MFETVDAEKFANDETAKQYICAICQEVHLVNLVQINSCGHIFGKGCLNFNTTGKCPTCRTKYKPNEVSPTKFVERQIGCLQINCVHSDECGWKGPANNLKNHECQYELIACSRPGCFDKVQRRFMAAHLQKEEEHFRKQMTHQMTRLSKAVKILKRKHEESKLEIDRLNTRVKRLRRGKWTIYVKTLTGRTISCDMDPNETIDDLKNLIQETEGISRCRQNLVWAGRRLLSFFDRTALKDPNLRIRDECSIHLIIRRKDTNCMDEDCNCHINLDA